MELYKLMVHEVWQPVTKEMVMECNHRKGGFAVINKKQLNVSIRWVSDVLDIVSFSMLHQIF